MKRKTLLTVAVVVMVMLSGTVAPSPGVVPGDSDERGYMKQSETRTP